MSQVSFQLEQVLNFFEFPAFLIEIIKGKFKVIALNSKLKTYSDDKKDFQNEIDLENFLKSTFGFQSEASSAFIVQLDQLHKSNTKDFIEINSKKGTYKFEFQFITLDNHDYSFISLVSQPKTDLKTSELDFYKRIFDSLPIGIGVNSIDDSASLYVNQKLTDIYGWSIEDLKDVNNFFLKVYPDEAYRKKISEMILKDIESGNPEQMQWKNLRITTKSGDTKIVNAKNIPLYDQNLMISTVTDVSESYKIQNELNSAKNRFDLAAQATSDAVWEWNLNEDELYWGDGYERLFGYKIKDNKVSKEFWESKIHPNDFDPFFESLDQALKDSNLFKWTFAYRFQNHKGDYAHVRENIVIVRDDEGNPIRLVGALQDITKPLKRENHLDLLEKLVGTTKDSIIVTKVKSNSFFESEIVYANSSFQNLFGFEISSILGKTPEEFYVTPKNREKFTKIEEELKEWNSIDEDILSLTKDDIEFWNNISISPIMNDEGWYTHWMIVNRNVNETKTNEEKRELLMFTHQSFQGDEAIESILCKISLKIESLIRNNFCEFWLVDHYSKKLTRSIGFKNGKLLNQDSKFTDFKSKDFAQEIFETAQTKVQTHDSIVITEDNEIVELSYGFPIQSRGETAGVVIFGFPDTYSRAETLHTIFDEFSVQLANEISRKRTENELSTFFEYTPDFLCIAGENGYLKRVNARASESLGYSREEFMNTPFMDFIAEEDRQVAMNLIISAKNNKGYYSNEIGIITQDDSILRVDWTVFSLEDSEDVFCVGKDVTLYNHNLSLLKTQKEKFQILTETVTDAVWDFDLEKREMSWGLGLKKLFGYNPNAFGKAEEVWLEKLHPKDRKRIEKSFYSFLENKNESKWVEEYRLKRKDGTYAHVLDTGQFIKNEIGKAIRMVGTLQDISEYREYQAKLENLNHQLINQAKSLSRSNKDLEEFAYVASHDLQEPLRMITGFMTRLEEKYGEELDEKAKEYINFAVDGAKRMRQVIQGLLTFSKVGRHDITFSEVNLELVLKEVKLLLSEAIKEKEAEVCVGEMPVILSVEYELKEVFLNLIENAVKYSKENLAPTISVCYKENKNQHIFVVEDNGIGISEEYYEKIFGVFQRLHGHSEYSGTGIGLAIVKKIINNLGGSISLESELNKGTKFFIKLPKKSEKNEKTSHTEK